MHVVSRKKLREASAVYADFLEPLDVWHRITKKAKWNNLQDVRLEFSSADRVRQYTVFNIKGNHYRIITEINYASQRIHVRHILTHAQYDRGGWK